MDQDNSFPSAEEYRHILMKHKWPDTPVHRPLVHHSKRFLLRSMDELIRQAEEDRGSGMPAVCVVENLSRDWALHLGLQWRIPPKFFVQYLEPPDFPTCVFTFDEGRVPGSSGAVESDQGGRAFSTMRGVVEYGKLQGSASAEPLGNDTIRERGEMRGMVFERHLWHTNMSFYKVHDYLTLILVDRFAECYPRFALETEPSFPNQSMVRLAFVKWPGHIAFPALLPTRITAVLPIWTLLTDSHTKGSLLHCLHSHGVDDFLYKASVFECQRHLNVFRARINAISFPEDHRSETRINEELHHLRLALNRLFRCIEENCNHERAFARLRQVSNQGYDHCHRDFFRELETEILRLDKSVLRTMEWLSTTMSIKDSSESLRQAEKMTGLTLLAFAYAPLMFTTSVFGMNLREMNDSGPRMWIFAAVLCGIVAFTFAAARLAPKRERAREYCKVKAAQLCDLDFPSKLRRSKNNDDPEKPSPEGMSVRESVMRQSRLASKDVRKDSRCSESV